MSSDFTQLNNIFTDLKDGLKTLINNKEEYYKVRLFIEPPNNAYLPHVQIYNQNKSQGSQSLDYEDRMYELEYVIDIYAEDIPGTANKNVITETIEEVVAEYMRSNGFNVYSRPILNLDTNVRRIYMRFTSTYNTTTKKLIR